MTNRTFTADDALRILTNGYPGDADFNMKTFVYNADDDGRLANWSEQDVRDEYRAWQRLHDEA